jgi:hypothetical protein
MYIIEELSVIIQCKFLSGIQFEFIAPVVRDGMALAL